jgi:hypothetical protein
VSESKARRTYFRSFRLTRGELASLRAKAHAAGLPVSTYLRKVALGKKVPRRRGQLNRDAVYQLSKIGNNLNQLARAANTAGQVVALERLEPAIEELREAIDALRR